MVTEKSNYVKKLQLSFILVLIIFILLFRFFPKFKYLPQTLPVLKIENIKVVQIPRTIQKRRAAPPPSKLSIPVASDEIDMLEEVPIKASREMTLPSSFNSDVPLNEDDLPYIPRQVIEALPRVDDLKIKGRVVLKLLIDKNGKVKNYKIISNTTGNPKTVKRVLEAVRKSRWEVVRLNENKVEYWITKVYRFN